MKLPGTLLKDPILESGSRWIWPMFAVLALNVLFTLLGWETLSYIFGMLWLAIILIWALSLLIFNWKNVRFWICTGLLILIAFIASLIVSAA